MEAPDLQSHTCGFELLMLNIQLTLALVLHIQKVLHPYPNDGLEGIWLRVAKAILGTQKNRKVNLYDSTMSMLMRRWIPISSG